MSLERTRGARKSACFIAILVSVAVVSLTTINHLPRAWIIKKPTFTAEGGIWCYRFVPQESDIGTSELSSAEIPCTYIDSDEALVFFTVICQELWPRFTMSDSVLLTKLQSWSCMYQSSSQIFRSGISLEYYYNPSFG